MSEKNCVCCSETLPKSDFRRNQPVCKDCELNPDAEYLKECSRCDKFKSHKLFRKNRKYCQDCERSYGREYRRTTDKASIWVENNRERMSELQHNSYEKNKTQIREKYNRRLKEDPEFRDLVKYRSSIPGLIHGKISCVERLNANRDHFLKWLSFSFSEEMSFDNYPNIWQVDHIIPVDVINKGKIKDIKIDTGDYDYVYAWYNIRPCLYEVNLHKNKYLDRKTLKSHVKMLDNFISKYEDIFQMQLDYDYDIYRSVINYLLYDIQI